MARQLYGRDDGGGISAFCGGVLEGVEDDVATVACKRTIWFDNADISTRKPRISAWVSFLDASPVKTVIALSNTASTAVKADIEPNKTGFQCGSASLIFKTVSTIISESFRN